MLETLARPPLVRWDGVHVVLDLGLVERNLRRRIEPVEGVADLALSGIGDTIRLSAVVVWKGVRFRVRLELGEIRLKRRFLGVRLRRARALGGMPVPMGAVERLLRALDEDRVTVLRDQRILVVDLRDWLPQELDISLLTVQATATALHLWFGAGSLRDLPSPARLALPATASGPTTP